MNVNPANLIAREIYGVDPGKSNGGISRFMNGEVQTWKMKDIADFEQLCDFFREQKALCRNPLIILEKISTFQSDLNNVPAAQRNQFIGRQRNMDKLKTHYVELKSSIRVSGFNYIEVMPYHWQKYLNIHIDGEDYSIRKRRFKCIASDWFEYEKVTMNNCDALLLMYFGRKKLKYDPFWITKHMKK